MASSKGSPGPHDRKSPRTQCVKINKYNNKRCRHDAIGRTKLCKLHAAEAAARAAQEREVDPEFPLPTETRTSADTQTLATEVATDDSVPTHNNLGMGGTEPQPTIEGSRRGGASTAMRKIHSKNLSKFVINEQSRLMLQRLGDPRARTATDPRQTLLDAVASSWRQAQVWEQMLSAVPPEDWEYVGVTPVPGSLGSAKGARIEAMQKYLGEATKSAARISKLAIDAGIEERLVRIAEEQAAMIAGTVKAGIIAAMVSLVRSLKLSPKAEAEALDAALGSAAVHLRQLAAGLATDEAGAIEGQYQEVKAS